MNSNSLYSSIARSYDTLLTLSGYRLAINHFLRRLPVDRDRAIKVLDAGCGTGMYSLAIMKQFPNARIEAFDLNEDMMRAFRSKLEKRKELGARVNLFIGNIIEPLPTINSGFDLIVTAGVLEYVDLRRAVKNLSEHLLAGGYFLNVSIKDNIFGKLVGSLYGLEPYSTDEKVRAFANNGFSLVKVMQFPLTREAHLFKKPAQ